MSSLREAFERDGFVVLKNFFSREEAARALEEAKRAGGSAENPGGESSERMQFYHNLYRRSAPLRDFCSQPKIVALLSELIGPSFWLRWDHAVEKRPGGEEYPWHQDNAYSKAKDASFQLWIALTDADEEKGGLWLQKGSHRHGLLPHRPQNGVRVTADETYGEEARIYAKSGDAVVFSSYILHRGEANRSRSERWVYIVEYMSARHYDPNVPPPYFLVAENGARAARMADSYPGSRNPLNRLKYYRRFKSVQAVRRTLRRAADLALKPFRA